MDQPRGAVDHVRLRDPARKTYTRTFRTRREADAFEAQERASRARGAWIDPRRAETSLHDVALSWLDSNPAIRPASIARDKTALRVHVLPALGDRTIGSLNPADVQKCVNDWARQMGPVQFGGSTDHSPPS